MSQVKKNQVGNTIGERRSLSERQHVSGGFRPSAGQNPSLNHKKVDAFSGGRRPPKTADFRSSKDVVKVNQTPYSKYTVAANRKIEQGLNLGGKTPVTDEMRLHFLEAIIARKV